MPAKDPKHARRGAATARVTDEQHALLELMLRHGQSYEDLSGLLEGGRTEVRARAHDALQQLVGTELDGEVDVCDYLLGQAESSERVKAVRYLCEDPDALFRTEEVALKLRLAVPGASLPKLPTAEAVSRRATRSRPVANGAPPAEANTGRPGKPDTAEAAGVPVPRGFELIGEAAGVTRDALSQALRTTRAGSRDAIRRFRESSSTRQRVAVATAGIVLVVAVLAQLALPKVLEARLRGELEQMGAVERVDVGAFPSVKALWGGMDSLELELDELNFSKLGARSSGSGSRGGGAMLERLAGTDEVDVSVDSLKAGPAKLEGVEVVKTGDELEAEFTVDPAELGEVLPLASGIDAEVTEEDGSLQLLLSGGPFGDKRQPMEIQAQDGQLVGVLELDDDAAKKLGVPPGMEPPPQPLFANDQVEIESLRAKPAGDRLVVTARARLTDGAASAPTSPDDAQVAPPGGGSEAPPAQQESPAPQDAPPGGSAGAAPDALPPELVQCLADEGVELQGGGGLPPGVSPQEIESAVQACSKHLPSGALP